MPSPIVRADEHDPERLSPGSEVGEYVLDDLIGEGGFARVYSAHHAVLAGRVAIKVITRALALDADASQRFLNEVLSASRIDHPGVVRVLGYGKMPDGRAYQVMELIDGPSLDRHLEDRGRLPLDEAMRLLEAIAAALDAAHAAGIVHRDLKPANILLAPGPGGPEPRLADFGIAKAFAADENPHLTRTGTTLGTPTYMSPEQALGRRTGPASDVYSFGVVAFELLTGRVPFEGESPLETMMLHVQGPPPAASVVAEDLGTGLDAPLAQLLAKAAEDRPITVVDAMRALRSSSVAVRTRGQPTRSRRRSWIVAAAAGVALAATAAVLISTRSAPPPSRPAPALSPAALVPPPSVQAATPTAQPQPVVEAPPEVAPPDPAPVSGAVTRGDKPRSRPKPASPQAAAPAGVAARSGREEPATRGSAADTLETPPDYEP